MRALGALHDANACRFHSCSNSSIISSFSKLLRAMESVAPTDAELLRAIAMAIRGQRCAWAPVAVVSAILNVPAQMVLLAVKRDVFGVHINGYLRAKRQQALLGHVGKVLGNAPREMLALARALTSETQPRVLQQVLVKSVICHIHGRVLRKRYDARTYIHTHTWKCFYRP